MAQVSVSTLNGLVKNLYSNEDIMQLVNVSSQVLSKCAAKGNFQLGGAGFYGPVRTRSAEGHAYISETGDLPTPQQTTVKQWTASPTVQAGVVQLTGLAAAVTSSNAMAFAQAFEENVQATIQAMTAYKEGALFRDGTGKLGTYASGGNSTTLTLSDDVQYFREGMSVVGHDVSAANGTYFGPYTITSIDWTAKTITSDSTFSNSFASGDGIYIEDAVVSGTEPGTLEPLGLAASVLTSGTYLGVSRSTEGAWKANSMTVSAPLDEDFLMRGRTRIIQRTGMSISAMASDFGLLCHQAQADQLFKLAIPRIHYGGANGVDLVNSENVKLGKIPVWTAYQAPTDLAYLGPWSKHRCAYTAGGELHIDTKHNGAALKWVSGKDAGQVYLVEYAQFVNQAPNHFLKFASITAPTR